MKTKLSILFLSLICLISCQQKPQADLSEFILPEGVQIQQIAAEPLISHPVAMTEDAEGRLWVVEMHSYMRDIEGSGEDIPDGNIVVLEDTDSDGIMDKRTVFLRDLVSPRAVSLVYGGLLYTDGPMLKWIAVAGTRHGLPEVVDSIYVVGGNIEHQPNGLLYNLDNWIYSAKSNARYRRYRGKWEKEPTTFRGQWGIASDEMGRLIYNNNSVPLLGDCVPPNILLENPYLKARKGVNHLYTRDFSVNPIQATSVNRGYQRGVLDSVERLINYTSACGPLIYQGQALPEAYHGSAFVCAPEANLIASYELSGFPPQAKRKEAGKEFLISRDETFRPVNAYTGLDGSLYLVDLRKGIIQHRAYMSNYLREKIVEKGLDTINNRGRIYKLSALGSEPKMPALADAKLEDLPAFLQDPNQQVRIHAQKELVFKNEKETIPTLLNIAKDKEAPMGQIHALWTLDGMDALEASTLLEVATETSNDKVLYQILLLTTHFQEKEDSFINLIEQAFQKENPALDYVLAHCLGSIPSTSAMWTELAKRYPDDPYMAEALVSGLPVDETDWNKKLTQSKDDPSLCAVLEKSLANLQAEAIQTPQFYTQLIDDDRTNGLKLFKTTCATCHGLDGQGIPQLAPSLAASDIMKNSEVQVVSFILNGYQKEGSAFNAPMPSYIADPNFSNQDIVDLLRYLKSAFTDGWSQIRVEQVDSLRKASPLYVQ